MIDPEWHPGMSGDLERLLKEGLPDIPVSDELHKDVSFSVQKTGYIVPVSIDLMLDFTPWNEWPIWAKKRYFILGRGLGKVECRDGRPNQKPPRVVWYHPRPIRRLIYPDGDRRERVYSSDEED
jgi:hypothetical protein